MGITVKDIEMVKREVQIGRKVKLRSPILSERKKGDICDGVVKEKHHTTFMVVYKVRNAELRTSFRYSELLFEKAVIKLMKEEALG